MLKKPLIVGGLGNMGRRYTAVLRSLGVNPLICDFGDEGNYIEYDFDSIIIATPTENHTKNCLDYLRLGRPVLCEKPLSKDIHEVAMLCEMAEQHELRFEMVNQYKYCKIYESIGEDLTYYNYFQTGKDGLAWDCISIIAMAEFFPVIKNDSPVWSCSINGRELRREYMDQAYVDMVEAWLHGDLIDCGTGYIRHAHQAVHNYIEATK